MTFTTQPPTVPGRMARVAFIKQAILNGGPVTTRSIAKHFQCADKTIYRDIKFMRDEFKHAIVYDASTWTYLYASPPPLEPRLERLVPVSEVKKAYDEGAHDIVAGGVYWLNSHARKVVEGEV
jgi:hypothetical protein